MAMGLLVVAVPQSHILTQLTKLRGEGGHIRAVKKKREREGR
jgi:hypothetical protein